MRRHRPPSWTLLRLPALAISLLVACPGARSRSVEPLSQADRARLEAVRKYADQVLEHAADRYHQPPSPLLANGVNVFTKQQLGWVFPDGQQAVISNLTVQGNFMRLLVGLSRLTGDPKYEHRAKAQYGYYFEHFQDMGGLLAWGGHRFIDLRTLTPVALANKRGVHELKNAYPFYELMYAVNPKATVRFITGFWDAHVFNWRTLEISRHGEYGQRAQGSWDSPFDDPEPFLETKGLSFLDAGDDLIYSAAMLFKLTGDRRALRWSKRLAKQYVKARDPKTKLGAYQFTQPRKTAEPESDTRTESWYGDRARRQFGPDFPGHRVLEGTLLLRRLAGSIYSEDALMQLELAKMLGADGREFLQWTTEGMAAFARLAYQPEQNLLRPMLTDGTDLTGFVLKRSGYYGKAGSELKAYPAMPELMLSYVRASLVARDPSLWTMARGIARAHGLGDLGQAPGREVKVNLATTSHDAHALFALVDLYRQTRHRAYRELARVLGNNLLAHYCHHGYFTRFEDQLNANIDAIEPYALLALEAALRGKADKVPYFINGSGYVDGDYLFPDGQVRGAKDSVLYRPRKSTSPLPVPNERDPNRPGGE
jgi:pectate lyase